MLLHLLRLRRRWLRNSLLLWLLLWLLSPWLRWLRLLPLRWLPWLACGLGSLPWQSPFHCLAPLFVDTLELFLCQVAIACARSLLLWSMILRVMRLGVWQALQLLLRVLNMQPTIWRLRWVMVRLPLRLPKLLLLRRLRLLK